MGEHYRRTEHGMIHMDLGEGIGLAEGALTTGIAVEALHKVAEDVSGSGKKKRKKKRAQNMA